MRVRLVASLAALLGLAATDAFAAAPKDCQPQAIRDLERLAPQGYAVYQAMRDKKQFLTFLTCTDVQLGLSTAVHESVHILTEQRDAYPLIAGGYLPRQHLVSQFYPPREIASKFKPDSYVQTYLRRGAASSADNVVYLLDELNAYSHDLASASKLVGLKMRDGEVDHRAGLAALMAFLLEYVEVARERKAATWEGMRRPEIKRLLETLWAQAESTLIASLPIRGFGGEAYLQRLCGERQGGALAELLDRPPIDPSACASHAGAASPTGMLAK
jgi:hypothetical protein